MGKADYFYNNIKNSINKNISTRSGLTLSKPLHVSIQPNLRCNARCLMCDCWRERNDYIDSNTFINALKQLKDLNKRGFFVQISGGEPLIYQGIYDIFSFCAKNNIICKISTNGIALTDKNCDKIIASGLKYLSVSIDSHIPEIHDKLRGVENTLEKAVKGIEYLAKNGNLTLGISSVLMSENISSFDKSINYFLTLPIHRLLIQPIRIWIEDLPTERWHEYKYWINDHKTLKNIINFLIDKKRIDNRILNSERDIQDWYTYFINPNLLVSKQLKKCHIGYEKISISYKGDVTLGCSYFGNIGNINESSIKDLWYSPKAKKIRKRMMNCKVPCTSNCYKELTFREKAAKAKVLIKSGLFDT